MRRATVQAVLVKDLRSLWPLVVLTVLLFCLEPVLDELEVAASADFWQLVKTNFGWLSTGVGVLLMLSVLQQDPADSLSHDWLTRPITRTEWLLAKGGFLLLTVFLPMGLARLLVGLVNGFPPGFALAHAVAIDTLPALLALPILMAIGLLVATLRKAIMVVVGVLMVCILPAWNVTQPLFSLLGISLSEDLDGLMWVQSLPVMAFGLLGTAGVFGFLTCRREARLASASLVLALIGVFLSLFPPRAVLTWNNALALHRAMLSSGDAATENAVQFDRALACFPATPVDGRAGREEDTALLRQADWTEQALAEAGPGALSITTALRARPIAVEWATPVPGGRERSVPWLLHRVHVTARLEADSLPAPLPLLRSGTALNRYARISPSQTDYWLLPADTQRLLGQDPSARLVMGLDVGVLAPTSHALPVDGARHALAGIGLCRARPQRQTNSIEVECHSVGPQPALVSASLAGLPDTRVDSRLTPRYTPGWLEALGRHHFTLTLTDAALVPSPVVQVMAYDFRGLVHQEITNDGVLGGPLSECPLPGTDGEPPVERSRWADRSPHQAASVAVDEGVRLEVLDWRTPADVDKPVLLLLPGMGASAHSFDELAPQLAQDYGVVAMTRRGVGASSKPAQGYDIARLAQDVLQIVETLELDNPVLVGHSLGGEELSYLGAHAPQKFAGLIYLDAAYDRSQPQKEIRALQAKLPPTPPPRREEFRSYESAQGYGARIGVARMIPEGEILASYDFATGANLHVSSRLDAIEMGLQAQDYAAIALPALAIYAVPSGPQSLMKPWYDAQDPALRATVTALFEASRAHQDMQIARFEQGMRRGSVLRLQDADHWVFVSHGQEVLEAIRQFMAGRH